MRKGKRIAVIGAGIAGLTAAIKLAHAGHRVEVYESSSSAGGKLGSHEFNGFRWDIGPSLFTLPEELEQILQCSLYEETIEYVKLDSITKYFFPSGDILFSSGDPVKFSKDFAKILNIDSQIILNHLKWCEETYNSLGNYFLDTDLQNRSNYFTKQARSALKYLIKAPIFETMHSFHEKKLKHPQLVQYFDRYATYNGSNPYQAPAILAMIPHLEHSLGAYFPVGGMRRIAESLIKTATSMGVTFHLNSKVTKVITQNGKLKGLRANGMDDLYESVVSAIDVHKLYAELLPAKYQPKRYKSLEPSTSALVFLWAVNKSYSELELHNILFSEDYKAEFDALGSGTIATKDFTTYLNISSKMEPKDAPEGCENWFILINAPANQDQDWGKIVNELRDNLHKRINEVLKTKIEDHIVYEKIYTPPMHEELTGSYKGALYGSASNSKFAAFVRHGNRAPKLKNLYLCGGSVHPGGGIPLCIKSGKLAAQALIDDLGQAPKSRKAK